MNTTRNKIIEKANILVEALPYISRYSGKIIVIKYGGNAMKSEETLRTILQDVATLKIVGVHPVLIHGGGPEINSMLEKLSLKSEFINGLRVTTKETMDVVKMVLGGKVNKNIVARLNTMGVKAMGLCGSDAELIKVDKMEKVNGIDYGYVGNVKSINSKVILDMIEDYIPVIATIGVDNNGESYNINADIAAGAIGGALSCERLMYLTDIDGIREKENDPASLIPQITCKQIDKMIESGAISGGMIPKVNSCKAAIAEGAKNVIIINGTIPHSILLELFTDKGIGTLVTA